MMYADSCDRRSSDRNSPSTSRDEDEAGNGDADSEAKHVITKAIRILVEFMDPNPIFVCALESDFFTFKQIRDMKEKGDTTEKNKNLCKNIRQRGRIGYDKLKDWLGQTDQTELVEVLECIENGKDYTKHLETLHEKMKHKMKRGNQKDEAYGEMKSELQGAGRREKSGIIRSISKFFGFGQKETQKEKPSQEEIEKLAYDKMKSDLQDDLISFYKRQHNRISLSPLMEEYLPLLKFYEMPEILSVRLTRSWDGDRPEKTPVKTLRDVFYKDNKLCSNIYLTADAGYGKTALSKKMALAWCQAKKPDKSIEKHFSKHEITVMGGFSFVFVVLLRDSSSECDIDKLILNQICSQLAHKYEYSEKNVADILCKEKCLVILDGLDEWTHPENSCLRRESNSPHRAVRENVAVLTTTRPWKLSVSGLHSSQIDQKLELKGLSDDSAKKLKRSVISHLHTELDERTIDRYETEFNRTVQENHKSDITTSPLFLMYLLFLWFHKMNIGKSLADLYSSFIELLLSRTVKKETKTETVQGKIPPCFNDNTLCKQLYTLLTALGKLAFYTFFSETKENTLVFNSSIAEKYLSKDELTFCLKTGLITQSKVQGATLLQHKTEVSFAHKTMQEFLAALYIHSAADQKKIQEIVLSKCKCVKDILDMSEMFMFIVSISGEFSLSRELMKVINEDEITQEYRRSLQDGFSHLLKALQDMYISCCKEILRENEVNLCLQDLFIERSCEQEEYRENLKRLTARNKQNIRSVCIDMPSMRKTSYDTGREVIDYFALSDLENIEKIHYKSSAWGEDIDNVISPLLNSSVTSLYLWCDGSSWSHSLLDKVTSLQKLEAIGISGFKTSINVHRWRDCLQMTDKASQIERASKLLALKILPDRGQVRLASSVFGRCSETFLNVCSSISEYIKSKSDDVIDVWAAYRYYEHIKDDDIKPVFVVITKKDKAGISENDFDIIERDETAFSTESERVLAEVANDLSSVNIFPDDSKLTDMEECVSLNADSLIGKHTNLNIVSPSVKKSKKFGKSDAQISDELCIALYVHIKGLIPIAEEPFPSKIGEFRTDVLEGGFKLFHGGPYDYHEQLKMGLAIHANVTNNNGECLFGTLGGFLDYPPNGMCALTCAHVVLTTPEMQQLITGNQLNFIQKEVFQSVDPTTQPFGQVLSAVYRTGDQNSSGIDAALIQITQRHPRDGSFPTASNYAAAGFDESNQMVYKKGKVSPLDRIRLRAQVYKYGIGTEVTRGNLYLRGAFVRTGEMSANDQPFTYRLHKQITVLSQSDAPFADHGDSGALVFFDDTDDDSVAIGIVVGGNTDNRIVYVTPLCEILNSIDADVLMTKFINDGSVSNDSGLDMDTS